jgi:peptide subunit release factor RF-3
VNDLPVSRPPDRSARQRRSILVAGAQDAGKATLIDALWTTIVDPDPSLSFKPLRGDLQNTGATNAVGAVVVVDAAGGAETMEALFRGVCQAGLDAITFVNKWDRPGLDPLALLNEIARWSGRPQPLNWPVGRAGRLRALIDIAQADRVEDFQYGGAAADLGADAASRIYGEGWIVAQCERQEIIERYGASARVDPEDGRVTPVFFGSALRGAGVASLARYLQDNYSVSATGQPSRPRRQ